MTTRGNRSQSLSLTSRKKTTMSRRQSLEVSVSSFNGQMSDVLAKHKYSFVISDPRQPEHPIVYASEGFLQMTEYSSEEVIGRNCRFLQGPETDRKTVMDIREAIREERSCHVKILNYTKSRKPFWNLFHLAPVYSREDGRVVHFVGVQTVISPDTCSEGGDEGECEEAKSQLVEGTEVALATAHSKFGDVSEMKIEDSTTTSGGPHIETGGNKMPITEEQLRIALEEPDVNEGLKESANTAVSAVLSDLTLTTKDMTLKRNVELAESAAAGVVCSSLLLSLVRIQQSFVLADPNLPDTPIVHASEYFLELSGYSQEEVVGRNCRFLQGPGTDPAAVKEIRDSITAERACTVRILNYRKDGTPFWNCLHVSPVRRCDGKVAFYCGVQLDVSAAEDHKPLSRDSGISSRLKQLGAVGAVKVAVRGLQGSGLRRTSFKAGSLP